MAVRDRNTERAYLCIKPVNGSDDGWPIGIIVVSLSKNFVSPTKLPNFQNILGLTAIAEAITA